MLPTPAPNVRGTSSTPAGSATDDAHNYHGVAANRSNNGRGWVMVRAAKLNAAALVTSMERVIFIPAQASR